MERDVTAIDIYNAATFFLFTLLLVVNAGILARRILRYRKMEVHLPVLLWRDAALMFGLAVPFTGILFVRFSGFAPAVSNQWWWVIPTSALAVIGVAVFTYFEMFVIERYRRRNGAHANHVVDVDPYATPFGEIIAPWESPSTSASGPADTATPHPAPPPGDESEPRS